MSAKPLFSGNQVVTISLNSLADTAAVSSSELDNSTNLFLELDIEVELTGSNAAETGSVDIFMLRGNATGATEDTGNQTRIGRVVLNGTASVRKVFRVSDVPQFYLFRGVHASSGAYALGAAGNSIEFLGVNIQDV